MGALLLIRQLVVAVPVALVQEDRSTVPEELVVVVIGLISVVVVLEPLAQQVLVAMEVMW